MNSRLSQWGSIAEIVSGIAVVVTLIILILGIRENTEMTRALVYERNIDSLNQNRSLVVQDADLARIWSVYARGERDSLDDVDVVRLDLYINMIFNDYEKAYFSYRYGVMGAGEWGRYTGQICYQLALTDQAPALWEGMSTALTAEFFSYVNDLCDRPPADSQ